MIDRDYFFATISEPLFDGSFAQSQVDGMNAILDGWEKWLPSGDLRCLGYMFGTPFHETARTMQPVREIGRGEGEEYGKVAGIWKQVYYGRGLVQLTWQRNYAFATGQLRKLSIIGSDVDLVREPDLALRPDIAVAILIFGMAEGWFTGARLRTYFSADKADWVNARHVINGTDCATKIAGYAKHFYAALTPPLKAAA